MKAVPTPRTDRECDDYAGPLCWIGGTQFIPADFARTLERELTSAQAALAAKDAEIARRKAQLDMWTSAAMDGNAAIAQLTARAEKAEAELQKTQTDLAKQLEWGNRAEAERNQLRAEVQQLHEANRGLSKDNGTLALTVGKLRAELAAAKLDTERLASAADEVLRDYIIGKRVEAGHPCPENLVICRELRAAIDAARKAQP